ncbi:hypothetical protein [Micromonospora sp. IBHARD004]|uniref:hypothetical protein n=1 Tax=Micromonospora sp. IBHARD004 TaxID=3457764 RepID=UPI004057D82E
MTSAPDARLGVRLWLERHQGLLVAALPAGAVILLMTATWRRRDGNEGRFHKRRRVSGDRDRRDLLAQKPAGPH